MIDSQDGLSLTWVLHLILYLVFESSVQSGLLVPSTLDRNCNWSFQIEKPQRTGPNHERLVFCGLLWLQDRFATGLDWFL